MTFTVRLLGTDDELLAWSRVPTQVRLEGHVAQLLAGRSRFVIERDGTAARLSIECPDLGGIGRVVPMLPMAVRAGYAFDFVWSAPVWTVEGQPDVPMPMVAERRPVEIEVPTGMLMTAGL